MWWKVRSSWWTCPVCTSLPSTSGCWLSQRVGPCPVCTSLPVTEAAAWETMFFSADTSATRSRPPKTSHASLFPCLQPNSPRARSYRRPPLRHQCRCTLRLPHKTDDPTTASRSPRSRTRRGTCRGRPGGPCRSRAALAEAARRCRGRQCKSRRSRRGRGS